MATRNVVLTDTQSQLVDRLVASGRCQNASEALRARLTSGLDQARRGDLAEGSGEDAIHRAFATARAAL